MTFVEQLLEVVEGIVNTIFRAMNSLFGFFGLDITIDPIDL